ncbi:hypothetical protein TNCV_1733541 [Trichonephila clavipes]|nr:hypothetical protein TNCV_1733541 [Trichonephila clavipes]
MSPTTDLQLGVHQVQCIGAAGSYHPSWHDRRAGKSCQQPGQASGGILLGSHVEWLDQAVQHAAHQYVNCGPPTIF